MKHERIDRFSGVPVIWREHAFAPRAEVEMLPTGLSIAEIVARSRCLPAGFAERGVVLINDVVIPRESWGRVRPKVAKAGDRPIIVNLCVPLQGGGSTGAVLRTAAAVAIAVAAIFVTGGGAAPLIGALGFTGFGASLATGVLAAGIGIGGALALNAFAPPPSLASSLGGGSNAGIGGVGGGVASLAGNVLRPGGPIPRVAGTRRLFPPLACHPLTEIIDDDEWVEGVFILGGPHKLVEPRSGDTPLADIVEVEYETREGTSTDNTALTLITRQSKTDTPSLKLSTHIVSELDGDELDDQSTPLNSVPKWHSFVSRGSPDEIWLHLNAPRGMLDTANPTRDLGLPLRMRVREVGDTDWIQLPEVHFTHKSGEPFQKALKVMFEAAPGSPPTPLTAKAPYAAFKAVQMRVDQHVGSLNSRPNSFNGDLTTGTTSSTGTSPGWIGADWRIHPRVLRYFEIWPRSDTGFVSSTNSISAFEIYGKTGSTAPANSTDGTLLWDAATSLPSLIGSDQLTAVTGVPNDTTTKWSFVWVRIAFSGGTLSTTECRFFDDGEFSWLANSYFSAGVGDDYMNAAAISTTKVQNIAMYYDRVEFYLDPGTFPKGDYEIQIMRGTPYNTAQLEVARYSGAMAGEPSPGATAWVVDFFKWGYGTGVDNKYHIWEAVDRVYNDLNLTRLCRIWNEPVIAAGSNMALIAVKASKRQLENISVEASGYVNKWNGSNGWDDYDISSNPADHLRDVLVGEHNADPLDEDIVDDAGLIDWRNLCAATGRTANAVFEGRTVGDACDVIGGCGQARLRMSELWGVVVDRDRTGEPPVQIFSPANLRGFRWEKAFPKLPSGLRVRFDDVSDNYNEKEIIVLRDGVEDDGRYEDIRYDGLVTEADAEYFARRNLKEMELRAVRYRGEAPTEHLLVTRGDFVGVAHDVIDEYAGWARITEVFLSGGLITGLRLDGTITINTAGATGLGIVGKDGTKIIQRIVNPAADEAGIVSFASPFADPGTDVVDLDCLVVSGRLGREYQPMIVADVVPKGIETAMITFMDEAPQLHNL